MILAIQLLNMRRVLLKQSEGMNPSIERLITIFGEIHRRLITDAVKFLEEKEPSWLLGSPINRVEYISNLLEERKNGPVKTEEVS